MKQEVASFLDYVAHSPTVFQATQQACDMLDAAGFTRLSEHEAWEILPGGRYYVTRNRSALVAFAVPENGFTHCQIVASHGDSPTFKLKAHAEGEAAGAYIRLDVEPYGGMIMSTWFDRPLSIAGRALVREDGRLVTRLIDLDRDAALIPNMPIHFNRDINSGYSYNPQTDMLPLFGGKDAKGALAAEIAAKAGAKEEDVVACDLFLYNRTPASVWGANEEFFSCPRIDDLECAYTSLAAFIAAPAAGHVNVCAVFDNEEVGSLSKQGADSTFLSDVLRRITLSLGHDEADYMAALPRSFMLSADNAHATHPNHPELSDPINQVYMNEGVVIKFNANQKYTTDGVSEAVFHAICQHADVPVQHFANRSDMPGGSTLGNISGGHVSVNTLDIGLAQLAMHSSYETAGTKDVDYMIRAMRAFYETEIDCLRDGDYQLTFRA